MIPPAEALRRLVEATGTVTTVETSLDSCFRLVLAETVGADRDFPPADRSAMDGYALRSGDVRGSEAELRIAGEIRAGQSAEGVTLAPEEAVRIFTGAVLPAGADAVVMVEHAELLDEGAKLRVHGPVPAGQHVRHRGSDLRRDAVVLEPGVPIHAAEIAALASIGRVRVRVHRPPAVCVLSTGDEVVEPAQRPAPHQVRNSNAGALLAQLRDLGLNGTYLGNASDEAGELAAKIEAGLGADALLITGGVSVGAYDLVGEALARAGVEPLFHGVAMKPGKPILAGRRERCLVIGLPGNPVSTFAGFAVFVAPVLRKLMGYRRWQNLEVEVRLEQPLRSRPGRTTYHLARVEWRDGRYLGQPIASTSSGDVLSLSRANAFLIAPGEGGEFGAGEDLPALLWDDFAHR